MDFPSNSHKSKIADTDKSPPKKIEKVIEGVAVRQKKSLGSRFLETFTGDDSKTVANYVVFEVVIPAARDMIVDAITEGARRIFLGETGSANRRPGYRPGSSNGSTNYNRYSSSPLSTGRREDPRQTNRRSRTSHTFDAVIVPSRAEAMEVISELNDILERYHSVAVANLYELVGFDEITHVDHKWGWVELEDIGVSRVSSGYMLNLPKPEPLD